MIYALMRNGQVVNTIVASPDFISTLQRDYDDIIQISERETVKLDAPGIQDVYVRESQAFQRDSREGPVELRRTVQPDGSITFTPVKVQAIPVTPEAVVVGSNTVTSRLRSFLSSFTLKA